MSKFEFLKIYNSPFLCPKIKFYFGSIAIGTPYFLPRNWVKATPERAMQAAYDELAMRHKFNNANPNSNFQHKIVPVEELYVEKLRYRYSVPKKIGFDFVGLGWKTKWHETDYRYEWNPRWSFVLWKWQVALIFKAPDDIYDYYYWESWLYYHYSTDKSKSQRERIEQVKEKFLNYDQSDIRDKIANNLTKILKPKHL